MATEIQINADGDVVSYDGRVLEIFLLDGSKRFLALAAAVRPRTL